MRKRLLVSVAALALLLGACAIAVLHIQASDKSLLRRSVMVADTTGWNTNGGMFQVVESSGAKSPDFYFTKETSTPGGPMTDLYLRKGFDGPETHLDVISHLVHSTRAFIENTQFSDDFKRLLWTSRDGQAHVADLDGSHHLHWSVKNSAHVRGHGFNLLRWADDNKILELQRYNYLTYSQLIWRDARTLKETGRAVLTKTSALNINELYLSGMNVDSKGFLYTYLMYSQGHTEIIDHCLHCLFDLKANGNLLESRRITFPQDTEYTDMCINNTGDRVLWQFTSTHVSSVAAFFHRFAPAISANSQATISIYESRTDGSGMHELGHLPDHGYDAYAELKIAWVPNKKCVYFVYEKALYRLPVD